MVGGRADGLRSLRDRWTVSKDGRARVWILRGTEGVLIWFARFLRRALTPLYAHTLSLERRISPHGLFISLEWSPGEGLRRSSKRWPCS